MHGTAAPIECLDRLPVPDAMMRSPEPHDVVSVVVAETRDLLRGFYESSKLPREAVNCLAAADLLDHVLSDGFSRYARECGWVCETIVAALTMLREIGADPAVEVFATHVGKVRHWTWSRIGRKARIALVDHDFRRNHRERLEHFFLYEFSFDARARDFLLARGVVQEVSRETFETEMWRLREHAPDYHRQDRWMRATGDPVFAFIADHCRTTGRRLHRYIGHSPESAGAVSSGRGAVRHHCILSDGPTDFVVETTERDRRRWRIEPMGRRAR